MLSFPLDYTLIIYVRKLRIPPTWSLTHMDQDQLLINLSVQRKIWRKKGNQRGIVCTQLHDHIWKSNEKEETSCVEQGRTCLLFHDSSCSLS